MRGSLRNYSSHPSMARIPVARFRRVLDAMGEEARARMCESSGSEHSPPDTADLSDLVNSFIERDNGVAGRGGADGEGEKETGGDRRADSEDREFSDSETEESLRDLLGVEDASDGGEVKRKLRAEAEMARRDAGIDSSSPEFKRQFMARLRDAGFDAGLCKSRWEKTGRTPAGSYDYVDVHVAGTRYIVEVNLSMEFDIARPTSRYSRLLEQFPGIFVGGAEELKQAVKVVCRAVRASMKSADMSVPPWRSNAYMKAKWFSPYKRTANPIPAGKGTTGSGDGGAMKRSVGFEALPGVSYNCRDAFIRKNGGGRRMGRLAAALNGGAPP